jgi:hypothetical protein
VNPRRGVGQQQEGEPTEQKPRQSMHGDLLL